MPESNKLARWPAYTRVPPFLPVPLRARADGWTPERQARFIGLLAETGTVAGAARGVGMSRMAAYRLRRCAEAESFGHAWDAIVAIWRNLPPPPRKVTAGELAAHGIDGPFVIHMRGARFVRARRKPSNSALLRHLGRMDALAARGGWGWP